MSLRLLSTNHESPGFSRGERQAEIDFKNMSASLADLKAYLALRQDSPVYADIREGGGIGIPCFVLEDGTVTRDLEAVLK